ncbi:MULTISPECIES: DUF2069 domain-containing protein [Pseudomonas]|uniref:DUF2069 domain-containing protein n=1 Tax=Pseudomonas TaxID=286 RepID=UPI00257AEA58|nr:DUF2069 domain-containing protein [Pseudomonas sp.]
MAKAKKPLPSLEWLQPRVQASRIISLVLFIALALLIAVWNLGFADLHGARTWVVMCIQLLPLLLLAPGMFLGHARGHAWTCFMINLYFIQGILAAIDPSRAVFGVLETIISFSLFCSALLYTRWKFQQDRKLSGE